MFVKEFTPNDYSAFLKTKKAVRIEDVLIPLTGKKIVSSYHPETFEFQGTTVWSFPKRGSWATHEGNYRGNWAPEIPRNLILKYTEKGDVVLDQMVGGGTTLVEAKILDRNAIGVDINPSAAALAMDRLNFDLEENSRSTQKIYIGDARRLYEVDNESVDLIATHPPYAGIISYSNNTFDGDLSGISNIDRFTQEMLLVAKESFRVLKDDKYCAILMGDTRRRRHYVPVSARVLQVFLEAGFVLKEDIIKLQWNMKGTRENWGSKVYDFYKIAHEHLYVFRKPSKKDNLNDYRHSMR